MGTERGQGQPSGHHSRRSAAGTSRNAIEGDRIFHRAVGRILVGATHGEFVAIGFAEDDRACGFEARDGGSIVWGNVMLKDFGPTGGGDSSRTEYVLNGHRNASEWRVRLAPPPDRGASAGVLLGGRPGRSP